jgi:hypothetical protein
MICSMPAICGSDATFFTPVHRSADPIWSFRASSEGEGQLDLRSLEWRQRPRSRRP